MSCCQGLSINENNIILLEAGKRVSDVACVLGYNKHTIYCLQGRFQQIGSETRGPDGPEALT